MSVLSWWRQAAVVVGAAAVGYALAPYEGAYYDMRPVAALGAGLAALGVVALLGRR